MVQKSCWFCGRDKKALIEWFESLNLKQISPGILDTLIPSPWFKDIKIHAIPVPFTICPICHFLINVIVLNDPGLELRLHQELKDQLRYYRLVFKPKERA